ncbi:MULTISPECIES: DUF2188 domain-containing protein [unclassified Sinorhizobium]|uniref:DUF2188 domain-containing protein n=1 Tax=unclassified Sinorhizobium TaxID=2613772 RepID=UPI0035268873
MKRAYFVMRDGDKWKIKIKADYPELFDDQKSAVDAAVDAAHKSGRNGFEAEVYIKAEDDQLQLTWTYGKDRYPKPADA